MFREDHIEPSRYTETTEPVDRQGVVIPVRSPVAEAGDLVLVTRTGEIMLIRESGARTMSVKRGIGMAQQKRSLPDRLFRRPAPSRVGAPMRQGDELLVIGKAPQHG